MPWAKYRILFPVWKLFACPLGKHIETSYPSYERNNFCSACHEQINLTTYHWYRVTTIDGAIDLEVAAVNPYHAQSFFAHRYHRANIKVDEIRSAKRMTFEDWKREMKDLIARAPARYAGRHTAVHSL